MGYNNEGGFGVEVIFVALFLLLNVKVMDYLSIFCGVIFLEDTSNGCIEYWWRA